MPLHLEEFQREEFQGYVENVPAQRQYALAPFMPDKNVFDTEFAYNVINGGYGQMASITAWDSGAPLRDKKVLERMTGELGKVQHSFRLTEKELLMFNRPRMEEEKQQAVEAVYDQTDELVFGTRDREEWFRARAIYHGNMDYSENDVVLSVDFGIPAENKLTPTTAWTDPAADIIGDLQAAVKQYKTANGGRSPEAMHVSERVATLMLKNNQIKTQVFGSNDTRVVTEQQVNALFNTLRIPNFTVVSDEVLGDEGTEALIPDNRVVLLGSNLGRTLKGPTVENNYLPGIYVIPEITTTNPPQQRVFVGEATFPALERPGAIVHVNVG